MIRLRKRWVVRDVYLPTGEVIGTHRYWTRWGAELLIRDHGSRFGRYRRDYALQPSVRES